MQVYDDIQTELQEKTAVLKRMKQRLRTRLIHITMIVMVIRWPPPPYEEEEFTEK